MKKIEPYLTLCDQLAAIRHIEHHRLVSSTNDLARDLVLAPKGPKCPFLIIAEEQSAGRGRSDKGWWSPKGALLMSYAFEPEQLSIERKSLPILSVLAALSVAEMLIPRLPEHAVQIHWPNDVYVEGAKISGILILSPTRTSAILGLGLNVNNSTSNLTASAADQTVVSRKIVSMIDLLDKKTEIPALIVDFLLRFHHNISRYRFSQTEVISRANQLCVQTGQYFEFEENNRLLRGRCLGMTPSGALCLQSTEGHHCFTSLTRPLVQVTENE